jgi:hypothetical protein
MTQAAPAAQATQAAPPVAETKTAAPVATQATEAQGVDLALEAASKARKAASWKRQQEEQANQLRAKADQVTAENKALKAQLAEVHQFQEQFKKDPLSVLKKLGISDQQLQKRVVEEGSLEAVVAGVKAELEATKKELQAEKDAKTQAAGQEAEKRAERVLLDLSKVKGKDNVSPRFPNLAAQPERVVITLAKQLLTDLSLKINPDTNRPAHEGVTLDQVCEYLESQYPKAKSSTDKAVEEETVVAGQEKAQTKTGTKKPITTLTNALGNTRSTLPADYDKLSPKAQRQAMAEQLRQAKKAAK